MWLSPCFWRLSTFAKVTSADNLVTLWPRTLLQLAPVSIRLDICQRRAVSVLELRFWATRGRSPLTIVCARGRLQWQHQDVSYLGSCLVLSFNPTPKWDGRIRQEPTWGLVWCHNLPTPLVGWERHSMSHPGSGLMPSSHPPPGQDVSIRPGFTWGLVWYYNPTSQAGW